MPAEILALARAEVTADDVARALQTGQADLVIAVLPSAVVVVSLAAYAEEGAHAETTFAPILADPRFSVTRRSWFATIRLAA